MKTRRKEKTRTPPNVGDARKHYKDLRICTWNVRTLYRYNASIQQADVLYKYKADITAIQEMRCIDVKDAFYDVKDAFYERLEEIFGRCPENDIIIVLGDFNAKIGREDALSSAVGKFSLQEIRLITW